MLPTFNHTASLPDFSKASKRFCRLDALLRKGGIVLNRFPEGPRNIDWVTTKLKMMIMIDQACRAFHGAPNSAQEKEFFYHIFIQKWGSDRENIRDLKKILRFHDWITIPVFGQKLNDMALTIVIHADHDKEFQKEILQKLERHYPHPDISGTDGYAYLHDRTCITYTPDGILDSRESRPQRYATQGRITESGLWQPFETENFENIEQTRKAIGMKPSFLEYFRIINGNNNLTMEDVSPITWTRPKPPQGEPAIK